MYHTVKYLKFKQILWRAIYLLPRIIRPVNTCPSILIKFPKCKYVSKQHKTDDFRNFNFLNETHNLNEVGWDNEKFSKLWRYNLHYFEFLLQDNIGDKNQEASRILQKWIDENELAGGNVVTKDVPSNAIFGGVPAKLIKMKV